MTFVTNTEASETAVLGYFRAYQEFLIYSYCSLLKLSHLIRITVYVKSTLDQ